MPAGRMGAPSDPASPRAVCAHASAAGDFSLPADRRGNRGAAGPTILSLLSSRGKIDSINYLHYLIEWMANRATPYTFATNYVAFWELSFLPTWMVTRVDLFFPLLALKAVVLLGLALWLAGRELGLRRGLLLWTVFGAIALRHLWFEFSGVPTLKNDALHGAGFVLLFVVVLRAARRKLTRSDAVLLAFGCAFASVKYTGIFAAALAVIFVLYRHVRYKHNPWLAAAAAAGLTLLTSGHYYLHNAFRYGSPFYPFQINLAFIHLPGTADLSATSILYSLHDPRTCVSSFCRRAVCLLPACSFRSLLRPLSSCWPGVIRPPTPALRYAALFLLAGWFSTSGRCSAPAPIPEICCFCAAA